MKPMQKSYIAVVLLAVAALLLAACGAQPAPPAPTAEPTQTTSATVPAQPPTSASSVPSVPIQATPQTQPVQPTAVPWQALGGKTWQWINTIYQDGRTFSPSDPTAYTIVFSIADGQVAIKTDCNTAQGDFMPGTQDLLIAIGGGMPVTCTAGSLSDEFLKELSEVKAYQAQRDTLTFTLNDGTMTLIAGQAVEQPTAPTEPAANLEGPTWNWIKTIYNNNSTVTAPDPTKYTLRFDQATRRFIFVADCNNGSGSYTLDGQNLPMKIEGMTRAACPPPSDDYIKLLDQVASYKIEGSTLSLMLKLDSGIMTFTTGGAQPPASSTGSSSGGATPAAPTGSNLQRLTTGVWKWEQSADSSGPTLTSPNPANYTIQFNPDGTANLKADCNSASATYQADESNLAIAPGPMTLVACPPPTLGTEFMQQLGEVLAYSFDGNNLILWLKTEGGSMKFSQ